MSLPVRGGTFMVHGQISFHRTQKAGQTLINHTVALGPSGEMHQWNECCPLRLHGRHRAGSSQVGTPFCISALWHLYLSSKFSTCDRQSECTHQQLSQIFVTHLSSVLPQWTEELLSTQQQFSIFSCIICHTYSGLEHGTLTIVDWGLTLVFLKQLKGFNWHTITAHV